MQTTDQSSLRILKGKLVEALLEQYHSEKFSPMRLRSIIRASDLTADKKRETDEIIASYNEKLFAKSEINKYYFASLLMDLIGCEYLFSVIPTNGIPTYKEFSAYDSHSDEFRKLTRVYKESVGIWFEKVFDALAYYITLSTDYNKTEVILNLIYIAGSEGKIKYKRNDRLAMTCRMLYRMFDIPLK